MYITYIYNVQGALDSTRLTHSYIISSLFYPIVQHFFIFKTIISVKPVNAQTDPTCPQPDQTTPLHPLHPLHPQNIYIYVHVHCWCQEPVLTRGWDLFE